MKGIFSFIGSKFEKFENLKSAVEDMSFDVQGFVEDSTKTIQANANALCKNILDTLMTKETQETIITIAYCLKKLKNFDSRFKQDKNGFVLLILALLKKGHQRLKEDTEEQKSFFPTTEEMKNLKRFGDYAIEMYSLTLVDLTKPFTWTKESIAEDLGVSVEDILIFYINDDTEVGMCPKFILFLDHEAQSIVLSIRGTFSPKDAVKDIDADEVEFLDGYAHRGILEGAKKILSEVLDQNFNVLDKIIESIQEYPSYSLTITGHSLGAGTAELITILLLTPEDLIPDTTKVQCIALAPPPVFRSPNGLPTKISSAIKIYVNNCDCVPRLSLGSVARIMAEVNAVDDLGLSFNQQLAIEIDAMKNKTNTLDKQLEKRHTAVSGIEQSANTIRIEGYLFKRGQNAFRTWNRRWFYLENNKLCYSKRTGDEVTVMEEDLRICLVRPLTDFDRRYCFEIISPTKSHVLQVSPQ